MTNRLRVILWGTGAVGTEIGRAILDHRRDIDIVGAHVYSADKDGVDVGTLLGRAPLGVTASGAVEEILTATADCVVYTPRNTALDDVCALLASGKNVVTTVFLFHPHRLAEADRRRLLDACRHGRASVHGSGLNPGNLSGVLPLALSGLCRTIDKITLQERADWSVYESTSITFDNMSFGRPVDQISPAASEALAFNDALFTEQVWFIGDALKADLDEVVSAVDAVPANADHRVFDRTLKAGTTAGQRWTWSGRRRGETLVEIDALWTVGGEYPDHWPSPQHGWTLTIEGDPSMQTHFFSMASFARDATMHEHVRSASVATGMQVLNAVTAVCAAEPGFATMADLPLIRSYTGFGHTAG